MKKLLVLCAVLALSAAAFSQKGPDGWQRLGLKGKVRECQILTKDGTAHKYLFDAKGNLTQLVVDTAQPDTINFAYTYDSDGNREFISYFSPDGEPLGEEQFIYDMTGALTKSFHYGSLEIWADICRGLCAQPQTWTIYSGNWSEMSYERWWDLNNRATRDIAVNQDDRYDHVVKYFYDKRGFLVREELYRYYGREEQLVEILAYSPDSHGNPLKIKHFDRRGKQIGAAKYKYSYDKAGNITKSKETVSGLISTYRYEYF